jgi:DNA-binding transcriptional MerR regulator
VSTSSATWSAPEVADAAGVTYRQLDYWIREQLLPFSDPTPGTGHARTFTTDDRDIARWMGALVRHGIDPKVAAPLAADLHTHGRAHLGLFLITTRQPVLTPGAAA